jgi:hypothetical protein
MGTCQLGGPVARNQPWIVLQGFPVIRSETTGRL